MFCRLILLVIQIREFEHNPETQDNRKQELEKLMQDQETLRSSLLQWCYASYGEVLHISLQCSAIIGDFLQCIVDLEQTNNDFSHGVWECLGEMRDFQKNI